jgi:predicted phage terminase large subunit-like protein
LDHAQYEKQSLDIIKDSDPILYRQWKFGDWEAIPEGKLFKRKWFTERLYDLISERIIKWLRFWDLAATKEEDPNKKGGPDWAAGGLFALGESGKVYLHDMVRYREDEDFVWDEIVRIAQHVDGRHVAVRIEQEGAASGKMVIGRFARDLPGFDVDGHTISRVAKLDRARAWVSFIKHGGFKILEGATWVTTFLNEITVFPTKGIHDDQVDVVSGGLQELFYGVEEQPETIPGVG